MTGMTCLEASQPSLFGGGAPTLPSDERRIERLELGRGAWVDHCAGWLEGHEVIFEDLCRRASWEQHSRPMYDRVVEVPRLMGRLPGDGPSAEVAADIQVVLGRRYGRTFDRVGLALYRDGRDSVAWHGDQVARELPQALVATVSLGSPRTFALRPKGGGVRHDFRLGHGDLVVMGGTCQRTWEHCVPKVARAGPRIALMFRPGETSSPPVAG